MVVQKCLAHLDFPLTPQQVHPWKVDWSCLLAESMWCFHVHLG